MMASIKQSPVFNLSEDAKLGFRLSDSNPQFDWHFDPTLESVRESTRKAIQVYLAQCALKEFPREVPMLAALLEKKIFNEAHSKSDYMDEDKLFGLTRKFISQSWRESNSSVEKAMHATTSLPIFAYAPAVRVKSNFSPNSIKPRFAHMIADAGCKLDHASNLLSVVPKSSQYGLGKCNSHTMIWQPELVPPNNRSSGVGLSNAESGDSVTSDSGSGMQYDSEASFSHQDKHQNSAKALGPSQFRHQLSHSESQYGSCFGEINSVGTFPVQNRSSFASSDATSFSCNRLSKSEEMVLCCYIVYSNRDKEKHEGQFLEFIHSQNCKDSICNCERYQFLLSHYDNCDSAECDFCGPALRMCSAKGFTQPESRKQRNDFESLTSGDVCGKRVCNDASVDLTNPSKCRKLDISPRRDSSCDVSSLTEEPISPSGPCASPVIAAKPGANVDISSHIDDASRSESDNIHLEDILECEYDDATNPSGGLSSDLHKVGGFTSHIDHAARISQAGNGYLKGSDSDDETNFSDDPHADFCQKEIKPAANEVKDHCRELPSDSVPNLCEDKPVAQNVELIPGSNLEGIQSRISQEGFPSTSGSCSGLSSEKQTVDGISLIDFFRPEEIRQHMTSLKQKVDQGISEGIVENGASFSHSENFCQLCTLEVKLAFSPMPLFCSTCGARIKNHATYYSTNYNACDQFCFCTTCYNKCHRGIFELHGSSVSKTNLKMKKNDVVTVESWVQCDRCEGWQHQICALFNDKKNSGGDAVYLCPKCYLEDLESGRRIPLPRSSSLDASNLPHTLLSDHLEKRLFRRLKQEIENRAKAAGMNPEEVPQPADLAVRVVSSVDKRLTVKQQFLDIFPGKSYPAEFPYRSKVILLFQRIEGVDVCLFAMYVQEFGSACSQPNQRCVYISYLDSVKYFWPDTKTVKGEALRTFVYHEILVGYLDYCKKRGYATCYIWACPPVKGEDYILYCHPETQKTPRPDKLRQWYQSMLKKATEEKIVVNFSNLYEKFFVPTGECNTKVTAARLPYFDGDYWSSVVESMIKKIDVESGGDPQKQVKKMTRRSLKAMGHINPSADDAKDILLMQALGQNISSAKEDFIIVYLQFVCTHCHEVILSGKRWFCNQCKNYQLCERCHDVAEQSGLGDTHLSSVGQTHSLCQEVVNDVPFDTEDNDAIMDNCFLENRHAFLSFCQGNHYQFDSLRRAKHSSMMILYHLHNPNGSNAGTFCSLCLKATGADPRWMCEICPEFSICSTCYQRHGDFCHSHKLIQHPPTAIRDTESKMEEMVTQLLNVLMHASQCRTTMNHPCSYPNCTILRRLFSHSHACNIRAVGGCRHCRKTWFILLLHSQRCKDPSCSIPRCMDLKNRVGFEGSLRLLPVSITS